MTMQIELDLGNVPSVLNALRNPQNARLIAGAAAESYTGDMLDWIADGRSFTSRTGQLEQSIGWLPMGGNAAEVYANAQYGSYIEEGTRPHVILPKAGRKALKIPLGGGGGYILRRKVNHPGTDPRPFFFADIATRGEHMQQRALSVLARIIGNG